MALDKVRKLLSIQISVAANNHYTRKSIKLILAEIHLDTVSQPLIGKTRNEFRISIWAKSW